jgi:hypothetical protein
MTVVDYFTIGLAATAVVARIALFLPRPTRAQASQST